MIDDDAVFGETALDEAIEETADLVLATYDSVRLLKQRSVLVVGHLEGYAVPEISKSVMTNKWWQAFILRHSPQIVKVRNFPSGRTFLMNCEGCPYNIYHKDEKQHTEDK